MRPFEALLLMVNAVAFLAVAVPSLRRQRWTGWLLVLPIGVGMGQVLGEGFRWQMVPAYVLALALPVAWLLRLTMAGRFTVRRWISYAARIASLAVCSIVVLASVALPVAVPVFHFPSPTGHYGIGTTTYHWGCAGPPPTAGRSSSWTENCSTATASPRPR